jgi:hypothetical protein
MIDLGDEIARLRRESDAAIWLRDANKKSDELPKSAPWRAVVDCKTTFVAPAENRAARLSLTKLDRASKEAAVGWYEALDRLVIFHPSATEAAEPPRPDVSLNTEAEFREHLLRMVKTIFKK